VWPLLADDGMLRVAILNKDIDVPCNVRLSLEPAYCTTPATLSRLMPGAKGMASKDGITWRNQTYDSTSNGKMIGRAVDEKVPVAGPGPDGRCAVTVPMPLASGAVVEVKRARVTFT
jgi:hypothetical protein